MHRTTIHTRLFRLIYGSPKRSDILRSIKVCIQSIDFTFFICTLKNLICSFTYVFTARTSLRSVSRINNNKSNAIEHSFVSKKRTQLTKRPSAEFCSKRFVSSFGSKTNISQILNRNSFALFFSSLYNRLCNSVIEYSSRCSFFATKPFQKLFRTSCAFALNRTTNFLFLFPIGVNPISRMFNPIRSNNNISKTKVYTDKGFNIINVLFRNINSLKQIEFTFFVNQVRFALNERQVSRIMTNKIDFLPTTNTPQRNNIIRLICHNTGIISNASKWSKSTFGFLIKFVGISNLCYRSNKHLGRKFERRFISVVNFVMEFEIIEYTFRPSHLGNSITNSICFTDSFQKQVNLFVIRQKFDFQRQFHKTNIQLFSDIRKYINQIINQRGNVAQFLPLPKGEGYYLSLN